MIKQLLPYWPQIATLVYLSVRSLSMILAHGREEKQDNSKFSLFFGMIIFTFVLFKGGYFSYIGGSQIIYILVSTLGLWAILFTDTPLNKTKITDGSFVSVFIYLFANVGLYYWGGFYDKFFQLLMTF